MFSAEDFDTHECDLSIKELKTIPVVDYLDVSCKSKKLMNGWGVDGVLYTFEVVPRQPIPIVMTSDEFLHEQGSDEDLTEPQIWVVTF
jgi:hypothetical protein